MSHDPQPERPAADARREIRITRNVTRAVLAGYYRDRPGWELALVDLLADGQPDAPLTLADLCGPLGWALGRLPDFRTDDPTALHDYLAATYGIAEGPA